MTSIQESMMKREDRVVSRTLIGILTTPLGLLVGMGFIIAF